MVIFPVPRKPNNAMGCVSCKPMGPAGSAILLGDHAEGTDVKKDVAWLALWETETGLRAGDKISLERLQAQRRTHQEVSLVPKSGSTKASYSCVLRVQRSLALHSP